MSFTKTNPRPVTPHVEDGSLELMMQQTEDAVLILKVGKHLDESSVTYTNQAFFKLTQYPIDTILKDNAKTVFERLIPSTTEDMYRIYQRAVAGRQSRIEATVKRQDMVELWLDLSIIPISTNPNHITHIAFTGRDITNQKKLQEKSVQLQRAIAMSSLATSLGHELNNPLAYSRSNVDYCLERWEQIMHKIAPEEEPSELKTQMLDLYHALAEAKDGLDRSCQIAGELRQFSYAQQSNTHETTDLSMVLQDVLANSRDLLTTAASLEVEIQALPLVEGQSSQLKFAIQQLFQVFGQLLPQDKCDNAVMFIASEHQESGEIHVSLSDQQIQLRDEDIEQFFEPFYTPQPDRISSNLSLTLCRTIIEAQRGHIEVISTPGEKGIAFLLRFRIAPPPTPKQPVPPLAKKIKVLAIDDNRPLLRSLSRLLAELHDVTTEHSPRNALASFAQDPDYDVDLVLCDMRMPEMSGKELVEHLVKLRPHYASRIIIMTACAPSPTQQAVLNLHRIPVLLKPFSRDELLQTMSVHLSKNSPKVQHS